jgi:hypothetical protein
VLIERNVFDGSWLDGQTGWAIILKSENQNDGLGCRWCRTTDVTIQLNLIKNAGAGINVSPAGPHAPVDTAPRRIVVRETVLDGIGVAPYTGDQRGLQVLVGISHVMIEKTVMTGSYNAASFSRAVTQAPIATTCGIAARMASIGSNVGPGSPTINLYAPTPCGRTSHGRRVQRLISVRLQLGQQ